MYSLRIGTALSIHRKATMSDQNMLVRMYHGNYGPLKVHTCRRGCFSDEPVSRRVLSVARLGAHSLSVASEKLIGPRALNAAAASICGGEGGRQLQDGIHISRIYFRFDFFYFQFVFISLSQATNG